MLRTGRTPLPMPDLALIAADIANAYQPPHTGSLSRIGEADTVQQLLEALNDGNYLETAAELAGLSKASVYTWFKRGEAGEEPYKTFTDACKRATARAEAAEVKKVRTAGEDPRFWAASMTYLERRHPDRWARRSEDSNSPKVIVQIGVKDSDVQVQIATGYAESAKPLSDSASSCLLDPMQALQVSD
jgi:hypothetical protein